MKHFSKELFGALLLILVMSLTITATHDGVEHRHISISDSRSDSCGCKKSHEWTETVDAAISKIVKDKQNTNKAKNVILFVGSQIPMSMLKTNRKYMRDCLSEECEEKTWNDDMPIAIINAFRDLAVAKTECADSFEPDAACSTSALLTGVRGNKGTLGFNSEVEFSQTDFDSCHENALDSLLAWAQNENKRTGLVTTSMVTAPEVSPAYGRTANFAWQSDYDMAKDGLKEHHGNYDLAEQLIHSKTGQKLNVILGGGRKKFVSAHQKEGGERLDKRNLIKEWAKSKHNHGEYSYVETREELFNTCIHSDYVLGLFNNEELDCEEDPSLAEMTAAAIKLLERGDGEEGYILFVQASRPKSKAADHTEGQLMLKHLWIAFEAIVTAMELTCEEDTLLILTTDYVSRDPGQEFDSSFSDSPYSNEECRKAEIDACSGKDIGEDSMVFANGPWSHLFGGLIEQSWIANMIGFAAGIGDGIKYSDECPAIHKKGYH